MTDSERLFYIRTLFEIEFMDIVKIQHATPDQWEQLFLSNPEVDPLNVHKPYGLCVPQLLNDEWMMGLSTVHFNEYVRTLSDDTLAQWIGYWVAHMSAHFTVLARYAEAGNNTFTLEEVENDVVEELRVKSAELYEFGEYIKSQTKG